MEEKEINYIKSVLIDEYKKAELIKNGKDTCFEIRDLKSLAKSLNIKKSKVFDRLWEFTAYPIWNNYVNEKGEFVVTNRQLFKIVFIMDKVGGSLQLLEIYPDIYLLQKLDINRH